MPPRLPPASRCRRGVVCLTRSALLSGKSGLTPRPCKWPGPTRRRATALTALRRGCGGDCRPGQASRPFLSSTLSSSFRSYAGLKGHKQLEFTTSLDMTFFHPPSAQSKPGQARPALCSLPEPTAGGAGLSPLGPLRAAAQHRASVHKTVSREESFILQGNAEAGWMAQRGAAEPRAEAARTLHPAPFQPAQRAQPATQ